MIKPQYFAFFKASLNQEDVKDVTLFVMVDRGIGGGFESMTQPFGFNSFITCVPKGLEDFSANPVTLRGNILRMR